MSIRLVQVSFCRLPNYYIFYYGFRRASCPDPVILHWPPGPCSLKADLHDCVPMANPGLIFILELDSVPENTINTKAQLLSPRAFPFSPPTQLKREETWERAASNIIQAQNLKERNI